MNDVEILNDITSETKEPSEAPDIGKESIPERLKIARENANLSRKAVAKLTGISLQSISNWEIGLSNPKPSQLRELAVCYGVSADFLLGLVKPETQAAVELSSKEADIIDMIRCLSQDDVEDVLCLIRTKFSREAARRLLSK